MKKYKLAPHVTEQDLIKNCNVELICENGICRTTLRDMYSDDIDIYFHFDETREVDSCGLDDYVIKDLIDKGIVIEIESHRDRTQTSNTYKRTPEYIEKLETLLELYRDYFFVVEQKYNLSNSENIKTELAIKIKELESEIEK